MQSLWSRRSAVLLGLALTTAFPAVSQRCISHITPDGFIDWSLLPTPFPPPQAPFSATLPVTGIPGLNVTVSVQGAFGNTTPNGVLLDTFLVDNLTLTFSKPVSGVRASLGTNFTRLSHQITADASLLPGALGRPISLDVQHNYALDTIFTGVWDEVEVSSQRLQSVIQSVTFHAGISIEASNIFLRNVRVQSAPVDGSGVVPKNGLREWFRADSLAAPNVSTGFALPTWTDESGNHANATAASTITQPLIGGGGPNCYPVVRFSGAGQYLAFPLSINGLTQMTMILAGAANRNSNGGSSRSESAAIFWDESAPWGTTYLSPYQTNVQFRFATTQVNNWPFYTRPTNVAGDYTITTAIHNGGVDSLYLKGNLVMRQEGKLPVLNGSVSTGFLGRGYNNTYFDGDIAEVLIYDRALTDAERIAVTQYLEDKYKIR